MSISRYAFWRTPDGGPYKGRDDKYAPTALLAEIGQTATVTPERHLSWQGFTLLQLEPAVWSAVVIQGPDGEELNEQDAQHITWEAAKSIIIEQGGGRAVSADQLLQAVNTKAAEHYREPLVEYDLVTSISLKEFPTGPVTIQEREITALTERGDRFPYPKRLDWASPDSFLVRHINSTKYRPIAIVTKGRTVFEAADRGLDALNLLRGLWTLFATYKSWGRHFGTPHRKPIGVITTGPLHTLHQRGGQPVEDTYWYEPDFVDERELFSPRNGWESLEKHRRWALAKMRDLPYRRELERVLGRYAIALDKPNLDVAFLQLWAILEKLTDTVGTSYETTIERATWNYQDRQIAKHVLQYLRSRRNQYVHAARSSKHRDQAVYMAKRFIDGHLLTLIHNEFKVPTLTEYAKVLDLPAELEMLKARRAALNVVIRAKRKAGNRKKNQ